MAPYPWQMAQWQQLLQQRQQQRLPHALLLQGLPGMGKLEFAQIFAKLALCQAQPAQDEACGQCRSCQLWAAGNHPDYFLLQPEEGAKSIKIGQIRALAQTLANTAGLGGYQFALIAPADAMNTAAANALLKTLEEPPGAVILVLVTDQPQQLLPTIISRCQHYAFTHAEHDIARQWLSTQLTDDIDALLTLADGAPLLAKAYGEQNHLALVEQIFSLLQSVRTDLHGVTELKSLLSHPPQLLLQVWLLIVQDILRLQQGAAERWLTYPNWRVQSQRLSIKLPATILLNMSQQLIAAKRWLASNSNPNVELLFEALLADWIGCRRM